MSGRDRQDTDTSVGRGQPGADAGPTAGRAGAPSEDAALGLGGAEVGSTDSARGGARIPQGEPRREHEAPGGDLGTGLETGEAARGSSYNSAQRVDAFNTPGERGPDDPAGDDQGRDELRGRRTGP